MGRIFFTITLLFCSRVILWAQSVSDLDNNGGFKDFKIGDPKSKWQAYLGSPNSKIANAFKYEGNCCKTAFGFPLKTIGLEFGAASNKLQKIYLEFQDREQADGQRQLTNNIIAAFGKPTSTNFNQNTGDMTFEWDGNKIVLAMINTYKGAEEGGWEIAIIIVDINLTSDPSHDY